MLLLGAWKKAVKVFVNNITRGPSLNKCSKHEHYVLTRGFYFAFC